MTDDELDSRLERWGRSSVPDVDGAFANRLETDLRMQATAAESSPRRFGVLLRPAMIMAAVALVVVGYVMFAAGGDGDDVVLVAADNTTVSIPGSPTTIVGVAGFELPDGARLVVGPDGSATVAGIVLEPGTVAEIVDGRVELFDVDSALATTSSTSIPTTTTGQPTTSGPQTSDSSAPPSPSSGPATTAAPPTTSDRTTSTVAPTTSQQPNTSAPPTTDGTSTPPTTRPADRPSITLLAEQLRDRQVLLSWQVDGGEDVIAGWEIRVRSGDASRRVALIRDPDARRLRVERTDRVVEYQVLARAAGGDVLGRSAWVEVSPGG